MATIVIIWNRFASMVVVVAFAVMFAAFMVQIVSRYVFNSPIAWTLEICLIAYVWIVFWSSGILLKERQHIVFDVLYNLVPPKPRRWFAAANTASLFIVFLIALPGVFDYTTFIMRRNSTILHIPMHYVFGGFLVFVVAVVIQAGIRLWRLSRPGWEKDL
jgi:TRAP-type C4-dicarboxylate transport system permease small subunit